MIHVERTWGQVSKDKLMWADRVIAKGKKGRN